jgi:predicted ATPase/signal transduction histidine kinase
MYQLISESLRSKVFKITGDTDGGICKIPGNSKNSKSELINEYEIVSHLNIGGIRQAKKTGFYENKTAMFYEYFDGISLNNFIKNNQISEVDFFTIALNIVKTLKAIHETGIKHLRINSNNILIKPLTLETHIIDFSLAAHTSENKVLNFIDWEEELSYIAPEQTGHFSKLIDHRTDFYSLGIVLYEMWCGKLPFSETVISEIIHSHLVKIPPSLKSIRLDTPESISAIIEKLLEKNPDSRYQTSTGLISDLLECMEVVKSGKVNTGFIAGNMDYPDNLILTQNFHGRKKELELLKSSYERIKEEGKEAFFISGNSGVGKTALANEFARYVVNNSGIVLSGSYGKMTPDSPNQALLQAFQELATQILSLSDKKLEEWKAIFTQAVDDNGQLLIELVPEFKWILGEQKPLPELNAVQLENSMNFLFYRLLKGIANPIQPVVLLIDNFDKADLASWKTFKSLIEANDIKHVVFIFIYEIPGFYKNADIQNRFGQILEITPDKTEIVLQNLEFDEIVSFVNDSFKISDVNEFSQIILKKTLGNLLFIHKFLRSLYDEKSLVFVPEHRQWEWDREKVNIFQLAGNVIEYMTEKVKALHVNDLVILKQAACIGNSFQLGILSALTNIPESRLLTIISEFEKQNFIEKHKSEFVFAHDRIHEVAYELIDNEESALWHYRIFEILKGDNTTDINNPLLFSLANHLYLGYAHIPDDRKFEMALLFYDASKKAKRTASFDLAFKYSQLSISLLNQRDWSNYYETILEIYTEAAETGMIVGEFQLSEEYLQISLNHSKTAKDRIKAHAIKITHLSERHQFPETVSYLLKVLDEIGYGIKRNPGKLSVLREFILVKFQLLGKSTNDILNLPEMKDERAKAFIKLTVVAGVAIFGSAPDILPIVHFRQTRLSLKYGNSEYSPYSYSGYGFAISAFMGDVVKGYELAKMALQLVEKNKLDIIKAKVLVVFYGFLSYWKDSLIESINALEEAYFIGRQTGDLLYASFGALFYNQIRFFAGHNLSEILVSMTGYCTIMKNLKQDLVYIITEIQRQYVLNLVTKVNEPWILQNEGFDENIFMAKLEELNDEASKFDIYFCKLSLACLFNEYEIGFTNSELAKKYEEETTSRQIPYPTFLFFSAMAVIKSSVQNPNGLTSKNRNNAEKKIKLLKSFAKHAPQNFENKHTILEALLLESSGKIADCAMKFQKAVELSVKSNFIHEEAIAREHFSYFLFKIGQAEFGELMIQKAFDCFQRWGADNKCSQLTEKFPLIFGKVPEESNNTISGFQNIYDLNTIIKSNRVLSSENSLDGLLKKMVELVILNASCTKVVIALKNNEKELVPFAIGTNEIITVFSSNENHSALEYPKSVVHYVSNSKMEFASSNLKQEARYKFDEYVKINAPVSVCCIPIVSNHILLGVLYLENNLAESVFDKKRVEFFKTIASQLAISLDNVMLYAEMENKVKNRTNELKEAKEVVERSLENLKSTQSQLIQAEKMASLGELTAGIAHEIQNPLNFVNNFSEVSKELIAEMNEELAVGTEASLQLAKEIADDIKQNLEKINHHGNRASSIVKGMLQHARTSTGQKELTDINALADEFLRLAYHGLKAKDKSFNAEFKTDFDPGLPKINIIQQDIGRVILNLITNAFYAAPLSPPAGGGFKNLNYLHKPLVTVSTSFIPPSGETTRPDDPIGRGGAVCISVSDNGPGIPPEIKDKIFQPFFTTKPTGSGTGLGLSLSYDIVKAHGGTLKVNTLFADIAEKDGESVLDRQTGTEFIVQLPLNP